jgi:uncharacterized membrane protein
MAARKTSAHLTKVPFFALEILGFALSSYLFMVSAELIGGKLPCARSKWIACESAVKGPFSHIGPFSVAAMGVIYYIIHLALTSGLKDRTAQILKVLMVAGGLVFVAWLRALEIVWLKKLCPWCWGVAALTLIHAGISYRLAAPPLPRLRLPALIAAIIVGFLILVGVVTGAELGIKTGHMLLNQGSRDSVKEPESKEVSKNSSAKPAKTPRVVASATAAPSTTEAETPAASPTPKAQPLPDEPEVVDTPETRILKKRGWRHAASGDDIKKIIKMKSSVLLLVYDPYCNDCHHLITTAIDSDEIADLPATKVAIQDSMLTGDVSAMVGKEIPTMMLFKKEGNEATIPWKHVGSTITKEQLAEEITSKLGPAAAAPAATP